METMNRKYAVFILSYGRSEKVFTYETIRKMGYTGDIYIVCSTDDSQLENYQKKFDNVIVFDKNDYRGKFDLGDNFEKQNTVTFARNANFDIARKLGLTHFIQLDDDYTGFQYKVPKKGKLSVASPKNLDRIFNTFFDYLDSTPTTSVAMAQGGDFLGGVNHPFFWKKMLGAKRKIMNVYFNRVDRPYTFFGRGNDDVNTYVQNGKWGYLFFTHPFVSMVQPQTQTNSGGLTEFYKASGTYVKSFYTILFNPTACLVKEMGISHRRLHHSIQWKYAVPQIISQDYKKK